MKDKQVTLFGASGLIGGFLIKQLIEVTSITQINVVSRRAIPYKNKKIVFFHITFLDQKELEKTIANSAVVFSTIGTTQAKVNGDKDAYRKIDFDINLSIAKSCLKMKVD
ncbi:MAG: nucleoside-diphosphate-sugar epimerase, partial [Flavobacteriaceae bacterium]